MRNVLMTFSGLAANFGGVPLAFAFVAAMGRLGAITVFLKALGIDLYGNGFSLYTFVGLCIVYLYFQLPLMVLVITPTTDMPLPMPIKAASKGRQFVRISDR